MARARWKFKRPARPSGLEAVAVPELPEVEVVRAGLIPLVSGATVTAVEVFDERSLKRHVGRGGVAGSVEDFVGRLEGATFRFPSRRGKFLWLPIEGRSEALLGHLGMSGQMLSRAVDAPDDRHLRVRLVLDGPQGRYALAFVDQRIFGSLAVDELAPCADDEAQRIPSQVAHIARDPLDPHFDDDLFLVRLSQRGQGIKAALLDQGLISGIGNIYADETLWLTRLHYAQSASTVSKRKARELLLNVRIVLEKALAEGGTSFDSLYVNVNGQSGYFAHSLNVYGRHGKPCPRCGRPIVRESFQNRGSHFCPKCQRLR